MAYLHAQKENFPDFKKKLPSGTIWASPGKKDGYLRASVLQSLAKRVGDEPLPLELITAGTFADTRPETGKEVTDRIAALELSHKMVKRLRGVAESEEDVCDDEDDWCEFPHDELNVEPMEVTMDILKMWS